MINKLLAVVVLLPGLAVALPKIPPIPVTLAYVEGEGAVGVQRAEQIFDIGAAVMRLVGIPVYRQKTMWFNVRTAECDSLSLIDRHTCLDQWISVLRAPRNGLVYVALPPIQDKWMTGVASGICRYGRSSAVATGNMRYLDALDIRGYWMSVIAVTHELGHLVGMWHLSDRCTVMRPDALVCVDQKKMPLRYASISVWEAKTCMDIRNGKNKRSYSAPVFEEVRK